MFHVPLVFDSVAFVFFTEAGNLINILEAPPTAR